MFFSAWSNSKILHLGSEDVKGVTSCRICFVESDDRSRSAANGKRVLEPDPSGGLAVFQLVEPLEEAHNSVLSEGFDVSIHSRPHESDYKT